MSKTVELTEEECSAVHDMLSMLSGHNPEYVFDYFASGELDDPNDPATSAFVKIFRCAGAAVPPNCE